MREVRLYEKNRKLYLVHFGYINLIQATEIFVSEPIRFFKIDRKGQATDLTIEFNKRMLQALYKVKIQNMTQDEIIKEIKELYTEYN